MSPDNEIVHRTIGGAIRNFDLLDANSNTFDVPLNLSFQHFFFLFFTKEESNADMLVSEQVDVAAMAVVSLRWSSRSASDHLVGVAGC